MNRKIDIPRLRGVGRIVCLTLSLAVLSLSFLAIQGAASPLTLTLTYSVPSGNDPGVYSLNMSASAPVTGPIVLYWTINGQGPYQNTTQMTNGNYERLFGCPNPGNWTLWFVWEGNAQYPQSQSNHVTLAGDPSGPPLESSTSDNSALIAAAVVAAIIVLGVVGAILYMRSRGRNGK
ncbi:MAG TPA: hypothetical protein VMB46_04225 [Methanomassiliicoccales archaeon]|nr:hypothetical protein [Methanomassiliicoccales archaeon]